MGSSPKVFFNTTFNCRPDGHIVLELHADVDPSTVEKIQAIFANIGPTAKKFLVNCIGEKVAKHFSQAPHEGGSFRCVIQQFKDQGGNFTDRNSTGSEWSDIFYFENYITETNGLVGKHVGFGQIVEAVSIVKALVDVVRALERAAWRKHTIIITIVILIIIINRLFGS